MRMRCLAACMFATTLVASPLAFGDPGGGGVNTHFKNTYYYANGYNGYVQFNVGSWDDINGMQQGYVYVFNYASYQGIECYGPTAGGLVSVNGSGDSHFQATLDPASPDCYNYYLDAPITINVSGTHDGIRHNKENGTGTDTYYGTDVYRYNFQNDYWGSTFTGTTSWGSEPFYEGAATLNHRTDRSN